MADSRLESYYARRMRLEESKREIAEDIKDLKKEMKGVGMLPAEIKGIDIRVAREYESETKRTLRVEAEDVADSLDQLVGTPLADAAVSRAQEYAD
jgi:uncharacterized protein (UPF0335 family)